MQKSREGILDAAWVFRACLCQRYCLHLRLSGMLSGERVGDSSSFHLKRLLRLSSRVLQKQDDTLR